MFGIANQLLAVLALATVVVIIGKTRRRRYLWVLLLPLGFVLLTTVTASYQMVFYRFPVMMENPITRLAGVLSLLATVFVISAVGVFLFMALSRLLFALQYPVLLSSKNERFDGGEARILGQGLPRPTLESNRLYDQSQFPTNVPYDNPTAILHHLELVY